MIKLDKRLNLVVPVDQGDKVVYVHSMPIRREVFERYFLVIARTFSTIVQLGLGEVAGPRVAALTLRKVAQEHGAWEGEDGVERGLVAEIRRLTSVLTPTAEGWLPLPYQEVVDKRLMSEDDLAEVDNALAFFTVYSAMHRRATLLETLDGAARMWGALVTSSSATEYAASLRTSSGAESTGATATASRIPH